MDEKKSQIVVTSPDDEPVADAAVDSEGHMVDVAADTPSNEQPVPPQSVMDVTPPPQDDVVAPVEAPAEVEEEAMPDLSPEPVESSEVAPAPAEDPVSAPAENPAASSDQANIAPAVVNPTGYDAPAATPATPKKRGKHLMVLVAVVLALVLASTAVLYYLKMKDDKDSAATKKQASDTSVAENAKEPTPVTGTDVDSTTKDIDTSMSSLDDKDFNADTLSDAALGLQ